ncbi:hypothetical protein THRCLA_01766 [Thraustotheca clavata]|uniref:Alpha/beta hydrolase fold-3 domain-containing protein n=1 Tax=Thraustotheca clavata TaxID=74557 RepID=A0A1W0A848_9STRA|nr:hypothetical protein THRCLA_01766 [Thraustotheca clavata]
MIVSATKLMMDCSLAPFLVLFQKRHPTLTYAQALLYYVIRIITSYQIPLVRRLFHFFGQLQRLIYKPFHVVETQKVKGLWYGQPVMDNDMHTHVTVLYLHGGGFACGSASTQSSVLIKPLVNALNDLQIAVRVFSLEYDLAPEFQYPHQINQAVDAYKWLLAQHYTNIVIMGDSAGGNLGLSLMQEIVRTQLPQPSGGILLSPWVDLTISKASYERNEFTDYLARSGVHTARSAYVTEENVEKASPGLQSMDGLAPLMVVYGGAEMLADEIAAMVENAKIANVEVEEIFHPEMCHVYPAVLKNSDHASEAFEGMAKFIAGVAKPDDDFMIAKFA